MRSARDVPAALTCRHLVSGDCYLRIAVGRRVGFELPQFIRRGHRVFDRTSGWEKARDLVEWRPLGAKPPALSGAERPVLGSPDEWGSGRGGVDIGPSPTRSGASAIAHRPSPVACPSNYRNPREAA